MIKENKKECLTFELNIFLLQENPTSLCTIKSAMLTSYTGHAWLCLPRQDEHDRSGAEAEYDTEQATHLIIYSMVGTYSQHFSADRIWWPPKTWNSKYLLHHRRKLPRTPLLVSRKDSFVRHCPPSLLGTFGYFLSLIYESRCPSPSMRWRDLLVDKKRREFWSRILSMLTGRNTVQRLRKKVSSRFLHHWC